MSGQFTATLLPHSACSSPLSKTALTNMRAPALFSASSTAPHISSPPTRAPNRVLELGEGLLKTSKPHVPLTGQEEPLWWECVGGLLPDPVTKLLPVPSPRTYLTWERAQHS